MLLCSLAKNNSKAVLSEYGTESLVKLEAKYWMGTNSIVTYRKKINCFILEVNFMCCLVLFSTVKFLSVSGWLIPWRLVTQVLS